MFDVGCRTLDVAPQALLRSLSPPFLHMYKTNELFAKMPAAVAAQIFTHIGENEKQLIKATVDTLAAQRKLRPIFVERKPKNERFAWIQEALGRKQNEGVAAHLLQIWLVGAHSKLLCDFLDGLGIAHDEHGTIEELPGAPEKAKLAEVVNGLFEKHDPAIVAIYLHAFQATDDTGWSTLEELLAEEPRLKL
jgi:hypothetical protein